MSWLVNTAELIGDTLIRGGPVMIPLTLVSLVVWALIIERFLTLKRAVRGMGPQATLEPERFLPAIGILASIAPLLGLLGTVAGMVKTFDAIALHGTGDPEPLAKGISQALITTQTGLIIAIPALLCYTHLAKKAEGIIEILRRKGVKVSNFLLGKGEEEMARQSKVGSTYRKKPEVNIAPLVDMVFLLLIFFMVTTTFSRETGVKVQRPLAKTAQPLAQENILIAVTREGTIHMDKQEVDLTTLGVKVREMLSQRPKRSVIILADKDSKTGMVIKVMDQCRLAGGKDLAIASLRERE